MFRTLSLTRVGRAGEGEGAEGQRGRKDWEGGVEERRDGGRVGGKRIGVVEEGSGRTGRRGRKE